MSVPRFPDRMVDVGGHRLHAHMSGEGSPTVVFDAALGASLLSWVLVQPEIARVTRTVSYDRAGLGFSEAGPMPRTVARIRGELEALLEMLDVRGPLVLVGHSFGALVARHYAAAHRDRVMGMVLVDPALPDDWVNPAPQKQKRLEAGAKFARRGAVVAKLGIARAVAALISLGAAQMARTNVRIMTSRRATSELERMLAPVSKLPAELRPHLKKFWTHPKFYQALASQIDHLAAGAAEVRAAGGFDAMPVAVVSAEGNAEAQMAAEAARLSSASSHVVVKNTGHWIQLDQPRAIVDAVMKVLGR